MNYLRAVPRNAEERNEQRKAARLSLDTSAHGGTKYAELLARLESEGSFRSRKLSPGMRGSKSVGALSQILRGDSGAEAQPLDMERTSQPPPSTAALPLSFPPIERRVGEIEDQQGSGPMEVDMEKGVRGRSSALIALQSGDSLGAEGATYQTEAAAATAPPPQPSMGSGPRVVKRVAFNMQSRSSPSPSSSVPAAVISAADPHVPPSSSKTESAQAGGPVTKPQDLESLMRRLHFHHDRGLSRDALAEGLHHLGYDLAPTEMAVLMDHLDLDADQRVKASEFIASQMDWGALQRSNRDLWLECARRAFADLDSNADGWVTAQELVSSLRKKLPEAEVDYAVEDALLEAGMAEAEDIDFEGFLNMLHVGSMESLDSLDQYDSRYDPRHSALDALDLSTHGMGRLSTVPENNETNIL